MFLKIRTYALILGAVFWAPFLFRRIKKKQKGQLRILVIPQLTRIGDLICATPTFKTIKEKYPKSFLAVIVAEYSGTKALLKNNPYVDEIIILKNTEYLNFFGIFKFFKKIRKGRFIWSINLASSTMGTLISIFGNVVNRVKIIKEDRPITEKLTDWMNNYKIFYKEGEYIPKLYLRALAPLNIDIPEEIKKEVFITEEEKKKIQEFLTSKGVTPKDKIIGVNVSAGNEIKEWGTHKFQELLKKIVSKYKDTKIIFIGAEKDKEKINKVNNAIGNKGVVVAGEISLATLPSLIKNFSVLISADSGPVHIAEALNVPLIDIVGPVDPYEQTPKGENFIILTPPKEIKPTIFALRKAGKPKEIRRATDAISVEEVMYVFEKLLDRA